MNEQTTRQRILTQALRLFSAYGYDSVSVGQIAKAVGIKAPSLYNHFASKQAIFAAIIDETAQRYDSFTSTLSVHVGNSELDGSVFFGITEDALCEKVRQIFLYSLHDEAVSSLRKMLTIEQFRSPELSEMYTRRYVDRLVDYHAGIFEGLINAGVIKEHDAKTLAMMYTSPVLLLIGICDRQPERESECLKRLDEHVRLFFGTYNVQEANHE